MEATEEKLERGWAPPPPPPSILNRVKTLYCPLAALEASVSIASPNSTLNLFDKYISLSVPNRWCSKFIRVLLSLLFYLLFGCPTINLGNYRGDGYTHPMLFITLLSIFGPTVTGSLIKMLSP